MESWWDSSLSLLPSSVRPLVLALTTQPTVPTFEDRAVLPPDLPPRDRELLQDLFTRHQRRPSRALLGRLLAFAAFFSALVGYVLYRCVMVAWPAPRS
jgi:hypothetical protein